MSSLGKACLQEISNSLRGLKLGRSQSDGQQGTVSAAKDMVNHVRSTAASTLTRAIKTAASRVRSPDQPAAATSLRLMQSASMGNMYRVAWQDDKFLSEFFWYFSSSERCTLAQVCVQWRSILYQPIYWVGVTPVYKCSSWSNDEKGRVLFFESLKLRGCDSICLFGATDSDIHRFISAFPGSRSFLRSLSLRCSNISDNGLAMLLSKLQCVCRLELSGCNQITEPGIWSSLNSRIVCLSISDCINIADDSVGAISQLLPYLYELNLQAYHVTDNALSMFGAKQCQTLTVLRLNSCWEITNHGVVNIVHALPNLSVLGLSGCSKVTDDGVEVIAENLRSLQGLDLSWCPRITDAGLEYIACDLSQLTELVLDRCTHVTDIGIGYLSTMPSLVRLFLRWCSSLRDFGLQHVCTMRNLQVLSIAGCNLVTPSGVMSLAHMRRLEELELTNCPGASEDVYAYLKDTMPSCLIIK